MRPHYCMKIAVGRMRKNRVKIGTWILETYKKIFFVFQLYKQKEAEIFFESAQTGTSKNTRVRKKGWTRWQTYATVCIGLNREQ